MTVLKIIRYCLFALGFTGLVTFLFAIIASLISLAKKNKKGVLRFSNISVLAFVIMIDHDAREFLHWVCFTDKTHLELGEYGLDTGYVGPYPPSKHNYEIYVVAMREKCENIKYKLDSPGANLIWLVEDMDNNTETEGHNVKAMGSIKGSYNPPKYIK